MDKHTKPSVVGVPRIAGLTGWADVFLALFAPWDAFNETRLVCGARCQHLRSISISFALTRLLMVARQFAWRVFEWIGRRSAIHRTRRCCNAADATPGPSRLDLAVISGPLVLVGVLFSREFGAANTPNLHCLEVEGSGRGTVPVAFSRLAGAEGNSRRSASAANSGLRMTLRKNQSTRASAPVK
jgi:hypothetical protein